MRSLLALVSVFVGLAVCRQIWTPAPPVAVAPVTIAAPAPPTPPKTPSQLKLEKLQDESDRACGFLKFEMERPLNERSGSNIKDLSDLCFLATKDLENFKKLGY